MPCRPSAPGTSTGLPRASGSTERAVCNPGGTTHRGALPAGVRVRAAVAIEGPLELDDPDLAAFQVRVLPSQSQRLALPPAECERHRPARAVAHAGRDSQDAACLGLGERLHLRLAARRRVHKARHVSGGHAPADGHLVRPRDELMDHEHGLGREALPGEFQVQRVQVLRPQPVDPMLTNPRGDPPLDLWAIRALNRQLAGRSRGDGVQPEPHPCCDRRGRPALAT